MSRFIEQLEIVLAAGASGRLPLIHPNMPSHQRAWLKHAGERIDSSPGRWDEQCRVFVEENYPRLCVLIPGTPREPAHLMDRAIALNLGATARSSLDRSISAAVVANSLLRPARYAIEIGLLRVEADRLVLSSAGRAVSDLIGVERLRLLLALEICQSSGWDDRWRVGIELARHLCERGWGFDSRTDHEDGADTARSLWRWVSMGIITGFDDEPVERFRPSPVTPHILAPLIAEHDTPIMHLTRALLADETTRVFGDPAGKTATETASRQARLIAHEVRNRLVPMRLALDRIRSGSSPTDDVVRIADGLERIETFVDEMAAAARLMGGGGTFSLVKAIRDAIDEAVAQLDRRAAFDESDEVLHVEGDRAAFVTSLLNILRNAWQMSSDATVKVHISGTLDGRRIRVIVDDDGPGVPENARAVIFQDGVGFREGGSGLGLAFARRAVEEMHGRLSCEAAPTGGARFVIDLPIAGVQP